MRKENRHPLHWHINGQLRKLPIIGVLLGSLLAGSAQAAPLLRCQVTYAGTSYLVEATPGKDPYSVAAVDIGERFSFKAVMIGVDQPIDYIKLYVYFQTRRKDIPIHQATYLPPFTVPETASVQPYPLTPHNYLYAGEVERELQYQCTLQGVQP
ncbi:MAG: hypothetical protein V4488_12545 [Pseudomonadota bacterium]